MILLTHNLPYVHTTNIYKEIKTNQIIWICSHLHILPSKEQQMKIHNCNWHDDVLSLNPIKILPYDTLMLDYSLEFLKLFQYKCN